MAFFRPSSEQKRGMAMKPKELCEDIRKYCRANADEAVIRKYSHYFK